MNIIVTGASRGIGYETARAFAREPGNTVIIISRSAKQLQKLKQDCLDEFPESNIQILPFDLENLEGIKDELVGLVMNHIDSLDILINNAGFLHRSPSSEIGFREAERMLKVNLLAPLALVSNFLPLLKKSPIAHVVNIGSMAGFHGSKKFPGLSVYSASKAAVHALTECLAEEYRDAGIHINALAIGSVQTEMLEEAFPGIKAPMKASEMASYIYDFARNGQKFYNGKILPVTSSTP